MKQLHVSRAGRKQQVWDMLNTLQRSYTMYELAQLIHMSPSQHLMKILMEMVAEGALICIEAQHRPNMVKRYFRLPSDEEAILYQLPMFEANAA